MINFACVSIIFHLVSVYYPMCLFLQEQLLESGINRHCFHGISAPRRGVNKAIKRGYQLFPQTSETIGLYYSQHANH